MADETTSPSIMDRIKAWAPVALLSESGAQELLAETEADRDLAWDASSPAPELAEHPRRALKWAVLAASAERYVADLQVDLKSLRARLDAQSRQVLAEGGVKVTESMITACVDSDASFIAALRAYHEACALARLCSDMRELCRERKELLTQLAAPPQPDARDGRGFTLSQAARWAQAPSGPNRIPIK